MKKVLLFFCVSLFLYANDIVEKNASASLEKPKNTFLNLDYISSLKKGSKRDFFINEYLQTNITSDDAFKTLSLIDNMNNKLFYNFAKKYKHDETSAVSLCMKMDMRNLIDSYPDCIVNGLSLKKASALSSVDLQMLIQKLSSKYPTLTKKLKVLASSIPFTKLIVLSKDDLYDVYFNVSKDFRRKYFNYKLPKKTLSKLTSDKKNFEKFLDITLRDEQLNRLNKVFLELDDENLNANLSFLLALNAIRFKDLNTSFKYLNNSLKKYTLQNDIDKVNFWLYEITKNKVYLDLLVKSTEKNIYKFLANEILHKPFNKIVTLDDKNTDFINSIKGFSLKQKSLFYAIAKLKSSFDKDKVSSNFDIGIMQLNISEIKKVLTANNILLDYSKLFNIKDNIKYTELYFNTITYKKPIYLFLSYEKQDKLIKLLKKSEESSFNPYLKFEFLVDKKEDDLKKFLSFYYEYYNSHNKRKNLSILTIFQNL